MESVHKQYAKTRGVGRPGFPELPASPFCSKGSRHQLQDELGQPEETVWEISESDSQHGEQSSETGIGHDHSTLSHLYPSEPADITESDFYVSFSSTLDFKKNGGGGILHHLPQSYF